MIWKAQPLKMGWINDQFIKNCITILAEKRLALLIRTVDEDAFRNVTDITAALADLETLKPGKQSTPRDLPPRT